MGKAQLSFLRVEPFAAPLCSLGIVPPDPAHWPDIAQPRYRQHVQLSMYGNAADTAVECWLNSQRSRTSLPI